MDTVFFVNDNPNADCMNRIDDGKEDWSRSICSRDPADSTKNRVYVFYTFCQEGDFVDIVFQDAYNDNQKRTSISADKFISGRKHLPQKEVSL